MAIVSGSPHPVRADVLPEPSSWQAAMRAAVRDPVELCRMLQLSAAYGEGALPGARQFSVFAPREYIAKMAPGDPADPLLRQVLPLAAEAETTAGYSADPVGDAPATIRPGLIQKYPGRVLMVTTGACAVHCRYCFRRHFPYTQAGHGPGAWQPVLRHIASDTTINEVILSGGDPLTLADETLAQWTQQLAGVAHLRRLRVHTRLPIMIPQRVTPGLLEALRPARLATIVVVHANHPAELDGLVGDALGRLAAAGIPLLNQAVLLKGVNDDLQTLEQLCLRLIDNRVMPYYLHQLDPVRGAAHFEVPIQQGRDLIRGLRSRLPGYAVPRFVQDIPGRSAKTVLA